MVEELWGRECVCFYVFELFSNCGSELNAHGVGGTFDVAMKLLFLSCTYREKYEKELYEQ